MKSYRDGIDGSPWTITVHLCYIISMTLHIADRSFDDRYIADDITWFWEPHVLNYIHCNIRHIRSRDRDLLPAN